VSRLTCQNSRVSYQKIHKRLHEWYARNGRRDLPWRNVNDVYPIYLSEVMLQQTQVKTVLERFYFPFLKAVPTVDDLASAGQDDVLKLWQGLGYYNRCKNLHAAAKVLAEAGGFAAMHNLPTDELVERLVALPGVGQNTAHAVASFGFNRPVPVMEANLKRVLARFFALENPNDKTWWSKAEDLLDADQPFDYNQAMMDIGATVCKKSNPLCDECPLAGGCAGKVAPSMYPAPKAKKVTPVREKVIVCFVNAAGEYFVQPRTSRFLHGLYGFVEFDVGTDVVFEGQTFTVDALQHVGQVTQTYSHFKLDANVYISRLQSSGETWKNVTKIEALPLSMADQKVLKLLTNI
jgi:A/G-specific adenine glycosylase